MDRSNSNSEQSNLFIISSDSSRSEHKRRKEGYARFARRVKELLDVPGNDLEQLYQRVENIVVKYFQEHRVVDFEEMYAHIASLHSNSQKMAQIVTILENRLCKSSSKQEEGRRSSKTEQFQTTINSHQRNSLHLQNVTISNKEDLIFSEAYDTVSAKNGNFIKTAPKDNIHQLTPKANRSKKQSEVHSPFKHSPSKTNIDDYYSRNKEYESRIKEMMKEINAIKQSIPQQTQSTSNLKIELRQNEERPAEKEANRSSKQIKPATQSKRQHPRIMDEDKTPSSSYIHELTNIQGNKQKETILLPKERVQDRQKKTNFEMLLRNAQNITRQINELRQTASSKQLQSQQQILNIRNESETHVLPPQVINEMIRKASEGKNKKPILQQMENTTSQINISQNMIPSFKNLNHPNKQKQIFTTELDVPASKHPINNSFHQPNPSQQVDLSSSQVVNSFQPSPQPPYNLSTIKYVYNPYPNSHIYPNHSLYMQPEQLRQPQLFQPAPLPIQRAPYESKEKPFVSRQAPNRIYLNQMSSPLSSSNNSSTSIMHPHLFARQTFSQVVPPEGQRSIINQLPRGSINTIYSSPSSIGSGKSLQSSQNSPSSASLPRRGLNLISQKP